MSNKTKVHSALEKCIEQVGTEWGTMEDVGFFYETDLQSRLLGILWEDRYLRTSVTLGPLATKVEIPLAHTECLSAKGRKLVHQGPFDIVVFDDLSIHKFAIQTRHLPNWQEELRKLHALAAVEIKSKNCDIWNDNIESDLDKLVERIGVDPIEQGYLLIFYDANKKQKLSLSAIKPIVSQKRKQLPDGKEVKLFFAPCCVASLYPTWI